MDRFLRGDFFCVFLDDRFFDGVLLLERDFRLDLDFVSGLSFESCRRDLLFNGLLFTISGGESDFPSELRP